MHACRETEAEGQTNRGGGRTDHVMAIIFYSLSLSLLPALSFDSSACLSVPLFYSYPRHFLPPADLHLVLSICLSIYRSVDLVRLNPHPRHIVLYCVKEGWKRQQGGVLKNCTFRIIYST